MTVSPLKHEVVRRDTGRTFPVVFASLGLLIVLSCLVLGWLLRKFRRRRRLQATNVHLEEAGIPMTSTTHQNRVNQVFPSHPSIPRSLKHQSSFAVRTYDPYAETPFPQNPEYTASSASGRQETGSSPKTENLSSNGLFSPTKQKESWSGTICRVAGYVQEQPAVSVRPPSILEYMLPLPEPMPLKPRRAGRPPGLTKQLERFPLPRSSFEVTTTSEHRDRGVANIAALPKVHSKTKLSVPDKRLSCSSLADVAVTSGVGGSNRRSMSSIPQSPDESTKLDAHYLQKRAVRRSTWRSFASPRLTSPKVLRTGTVTRPKTPVAEMRTRYDKPDMKFESAVASPAIGSETQWTEPVTFSSDTQQHTNSTTATSPMSQIKSLPQIPTTLRLRRAGLRPAAASPTPDPAHEEGVSGSLVMPSPEKLAPTSYISQTKTIARPKPALLQLSTSHGVKHTGYSSHRSSMSSIGSTLTPLVALKGWHQSHHASSVYSRDTKGMSIIPTPNTDTFPSTIASSQGRQSEDRNVSLHRKVSSMDMLKLKIDHWDLPTFGLDMPFSNPTVKRSMSDAGPCGLSLPIQKDDSMAKIDILEESEPRSAELNSSTPKPPKICIARASDDIFRDRARSYDPERGRVLRRILDMELATTPFNIQTVFGGTRYGRGTAPGGADWI